MSEKTAVVVIGRNEAKALADSLASVRSHDGPVVYVDSASTDGSAAIAEQRGVRTLRLPDTPPRTAARGRNQGREYLRKEFPAVEYVQFVDGDCQVAEGWIELATQHLERHPDVGVVAGRLRERFRERNAYHRLADMEFDHPTGDVDATGGIAMFRLTAFDAAGGFDAKLATGEERELCARILASSMRIVRLPETMAFHDIDMDQFGQWWKRTKRCGFTAAQHYADRRIMAREVASMLAWGAALPAAAALLFVPTLGLSTGVLGVYALLWERVRRSRLRRGATPSDAALYATATVIGKFPEAAGVFSLAKERLAAAAARGHGDEREA